MAAAANPCAYAAPTLFPLRTTVYDPGTGFLLTGDTVYPGRLYVAGCRAFRETLGALVACR